MLDEAAFAELYDRHAPARGRVAAAARRTRDAAQELLAETFAEAWCSRRRFKPERGSARDWLFGIAQHLLFGYYRRLEVEDRARRRLGVVLEPALDDEADARVDAAALRAELSARLARLPDGTREAVLLRVVEQLDYEELGRRSAAPTPRRASASRAGCVSCAASPPPLSPPKEPCHERRVRRRRRPRGTAARDRPRRRRAGRVAGGSLRSRCSRCCRGLDRRRRGDRHDLERAEDRPQRPVGAGVAVLLENPFGRRRRAGAHARASGALARVEPQRPSRRSRPRAWRRAAAATPAIRWPASPRAASCAADRWRRPTRSARPTTTSSRSPTPRRTRGCARTPTASAPAPTAARSPPATKGYEDC